MYQNAPAASSALNVQAESIEAEFMYQYETCAPASAQTRLGIAGMRIGGGVALSMRNDPTHYWSKALGFGFDEPVTSDLISRVLDFYQDNADPVATIQIAPSALPPDWPEICATHGLHPGDRIVKLAGSISTIHPGSSRLRVAPVGPAAADEWAAAILNTFGMPLDGLSEMFTATLENPGFRPFAVWDGGTIVAGANLFVQGQVASLNAGATLPGHRAQGAQSALIAARAKEAADAGCRWLVAETGEPNGGKSHPSLNNMLRAGLQVLYVRQNWLWQNPAPRG